MSAGDNTLRSSSHNVDSLEIFFRNIICTMRQFSPLEIAQTKAEINSLISGKEIERLKRAETDLMDVIIQEDEAFEEVVTENENLPPNFVSLQSGIHRVKYDSQL